MEIALYHKHYTEQHLAEVKTEMTKRGAPVIRAIWSECYGMWLAIEGCHRIRAAQELGLKPVIKDISKQKSAAVQIDGEMVKIEMDALSSDLEDGAWKATIITFEA